MTTPDGEHLHRTGSQLNRCGVMRSGCVCVCSRRFPSFLPPQNPPPPPRPPPLLDLSSELHVALLPTASCDKPSCPLTASFLILAGETPGVAACVCVCTCVCALSQFKGTSSKTRSFQMTKHRLFASPLCFLSLYLFVFQLLPVLRVDVCASVVLGSDLLLSLKSVPVLSFSFFFCSFVQGFSLCLSLHATSDDLLVRCSSVSPSVV